MKKVLTLIIIGLLCFSTFSILAPQVKAESIPTGFESGFEGWQPFTHAGAMDTFIVQLSTTYAHSGTYSVEQFGQSSGSESFGCEGGIRLPVTSILDQYELSTWVYVTERSYADASSLFGFAFENEFASWNPWGSGSSYVYVRLSEGYQTKGDWYNPVPHGLTLNTWHQVEVMVYTNLGTVSIWLDGSLIVDNWPAFNAGEKPDYYVIECSANYYGTYVMHQYVDDVSVSEIQRPPVGFWKFDEGTGNTAYDSSGNNHDGIVYGASWVDGYVNKALQLNGASDYIAIPDSPSLSRFTQLTLEAWIKVDSLDASSLRGIINKGNGGGYFGDEYGLQLNYDKVRLILSAGPPSGWITVVDSPSAIIVGQWHHVAGTWDSTNFCIYVDGVAIKSGTVILPGATTHDTSNSLNIGAISSGSWLFDGILDEVEVDNYAKSAQQIFNDAHTGQLYANYAKLAETRAEVYASYADIVYYYSAYNPEYYDRSMLIQALENLIPFLTDLSELSAAEIAQDVTAQIEKTTDVIESFKDWLINLQEPIEQVAEWIGPASAHAALTYDYLVKLKDLCEQEAVAWKSGNLDDVNAILEQENTKVSSKSGALLYATGFRYYAQSLEDNMAYKVADSTVDFLGKDARQITHLTRVARDQKVAITELGCFADLHLYDLEGNHNGPIYGQQGEVVGIEEGIPESYYFGPDIEPQFVAIFNVANAAYIIEVVGRGSDNPSDFNLTVTFYDETGVLLSSFDYLNTIASGQTLVSTAIFTETEITVTPPLPALEVDKLFKPSEISAKRKGAVMARTNITNTGYLNLNEVTFEDIILNDWTVKNVHTISATLFIGGVEYDIPYSELAYVAIENGKYIVWLNFAGGIDLYQFNATSGLDEYRMTVYAFEPSWVIEIKYPIHAIGDINCDGIVDIVDLASISAHWYPGPPTGPLGYDPTADLNNDGLVNIVDLAILSSHWGGSTPGTYSSTVSVIVTSPEGITIKVEDTATLTIN